MIAMKRAMAALTLLVTTAAALVAVPTVVAAAGPSAAAATHYAGTLPDGASWIADVPASWNHTVILYSHGFGPLAAADAPDAATQQDLLGLGYALVGSSYSGPSWWALASAVRDQFDALAQLERHTGPPRRTIAWGTSMGGLISALEAEHHRHIDGALTTCGLVGGALNLNNYQLDGEYALNRLLAPSRHIQLVGYATPDAASAAAAALTEVTADAQASPQGRARTALGAALMNEPTWYSGAAAPPPAAYGEQEAQQARELTDFVLTFVMTGRYQIELAAGGNSAFNRGVDYARLLRHSSRLGEVRALYREAGLDLDADLATLTRDASVRADPHAVATLARTSMVTGRLAVPELDIHTTDDQLVPVEQENWYAARVRRDGVGRLLRQAYVAATGHCNFQPAATIAALHALEHRIGTGRWDDVTRPDRLNAAAERTGLAAGAPYIAFRPGALVGARSYPWWGSRTAFLAH
jgi:hypothetical protein